VANPSFTQISFRLRNDDGNETTATWKANQDTNATIRPGGKFRARFRIDETAGNAWTSVTWNLRYSLNGGAYTAVSATTPVQFAASSNFADGDDTTTQLTGGTGTFVTNNNGMKETTGGAVNSGTGGQLFETEWALTIDAAQVANANTLGLRIYNGTSAIATYTQTPTITVEKLVMTADQGSFTLTGQAVNLKVGRKVEAAQGSYSLTGQAVNFTKGTPMVAGHGSFVLTGNDVTLLAHRRLVCEIGATPDALDWETGLYVGRRLVAGQGSFTLTGNDVDLLYTPPSGYTMQAGQGGFNVTGQAVSLKVDRKLTSESGNFTITGQDVGLKADRRITAEAGSFTLTGQGVNLLAGRKVEAGQGSFNLSGQDVGLRADRRLTAAHGSFTLTGNDADLIYTPVGAYTLVAGVGSFNVTGQDVGLFASRRLVADSGGYNLTGQAASLLVGRKIVIDSGSFNVTANDITPSLHRLLVASAGLFTLTGFSATLTHAGIFIPSPARMISVAPRQNRVTVLANGRVVTESINGRSINLQPQPRTFVTESR
jgi:hypothetical protein